MKKKATEPTALKEKLPAPPLSAAEQALLEATTQQVRSLPSRPIMNLKDGMLTVGAPGRELLNGALLQKAFAARSGEVVDHLLRKISEAVGSSGNEALDSDAVTAAVALVSSMEPTNELETTMAIQMVAANSAALCCFRRMKAAEYMEHVSGYSNMANKAMRSFALHAEALAKIRRGGEQVVRHVHVNDGGQAVIAQTVNAGGGR